MHPIIAKTFGGLSTHYYVRNFLFGLIFPVFMFVTMNRGHSAIPIGMAAILVVNTFLYPYARFVYESIIGFVLGSNTFFVNAFLMLFVKAITMLLCWSLAIFIAPIGLAYLYYHHSKAS
jgi:hypothetical protein